MDGIQIKPQSTKQLSASYEVTPRTFNRWLEPHRKEIGECIGRIYTPKQVKIIYELIGEPIKK